jgi:PhzF family phenazine biosynthesis protein
MSAQIFQVDSFTNHPFAGNPAGVCLLERAAAEDWMQKFAAEMNLSETAFLVPRDRRFDLRWFTPTTEVELCGHATLASAHILWETGVLAADSPAIFETLSGTLTAVKLHENIKLDFPSKPPESVASDPGISSALAVDALFIGKSNLDYFIEIKSESQLRSLQPDLSALKKLDLRGVIVTALSNEPQYDFISRFFAPGAGINEDPVTGSAHCCLAPYWGQKLGKSKMLGYQASLRGGAVQVELQGDRVQLGGEAVTVFSGTLNIRY